MNTRLKVIGGILGTVILALFADNFGGVLGLLINWFAAFVGVISVPMILGLLPYFKDCGSRGAIVSMFFGTATFIIAKLAINASLIDVYPILKSIEIGSPIIITLIVYLFFSRIAKTEILKH